MHWSVMLLLIFGGVTSLMMAGMPVALAFLAIDIIGTYFFFGLAGMQQQIVSMFSSIATFTLLPLPLFILMGELLYHSGVGPIIINTIDQWLGRIPGRLSLLAVGTGTLFATLTGTSVGSVAMIGSTLLPDMQARGYKQPMTLGPIMASGGLAVMIPPSGLAVLLGVIGEISVGQMLVAIVIPGFLLAAVYAAYIILRCYIQPDLAPAYHVETVPLREKLFGVLAYVLPIGIVIFFVIGVVVLGIATPSEAAASGVLGTLLLVGVHRLLTVKVLIKSLSSTLEITAMILLIISGATAFGQILALSGASRGLSELAINLPVAPIFIIIAMQAVVMVMGMFMEVVSIMLITLPIFMPIVNSLGYDPVWFGTLFMVNCEVALISPPFGMSLFVMKAVAPPGTTLQDVYAASFPFVGLIVFVMALIMIFPGLALWLPNVTH